MEIIINNKKFTLLHEKALYKHDERLLVIADIHLGKARHFRKEGIAIPAHTQARDYERLAGLFEKTGAEQVYFLGDLFHSTFNRDWHYFCDLVARFPNVAFTLVEGNHDIIDKNLFENIGVRVIDIIEDRHFVYTHDATPKVKAGKVNIVGHIHPGVVLSGTGRQSVKLPCFFMEDNVFILPAFGLLTGLYSMQCTSRSDVWVVLPGEVRPL